MTNLVIGAAVVLLLIALNKWGKRPAKYRDLDTPRLRSLLELLYERGQDGGYLHVAFIGSSRFLRVYKYICRPEVVELRAHLPQETYVDRGLEPVKEALDAGGFSPSLRGSGTGIGSADDLVVNCGPSISRAVVVLEFLLRDSLQLDPERQCIAYVGNVHPNPWAHPGFSARPDI